MLNQEESRLVACKIKACKSMKRLIVKLETENLLT